MAFAADSFSISRMASLVGTMTNSTWRRSASRFTSFITGKRPYAPVPITSRRRGLLAFADLPAVDHHVLLVRAAVDPNGAEGKFVEVHTHLPVLRSGAAVFRRSSSR